MTANPWERLARRWRELYEQQAELARSWLDGQAKLAAPWLRPVPGGTAEADAAAMAELWRSWLTLGGSLGSMPGMPASRDGSPARRSGAFSIRCRWRSSAAARSARPSAR